MHAEPGAAPDRGRITGFARHPALAAAPPGELMVWPPPPQRGAAMPQGQRVDLQWPQEGERPCRGPMLVVMWPSRWCRGMGWLARERSGSTSGSPAATGEASFPNSLPASSGWTPGHVPISGHARCGSSATQCGASLPSVCGPTVRSRRTTGPMRQRAARRCPAQPCALCRGNRWPHRPC
jgi:hypothetical protein